jgi:hypothetical protein
MNSVFVVISETMPINGTYPASHIDSFWSTEGWAWGRLNELAVGDGVELEFDATTYYVDVDPEKYEYTEYRIEEHTIQTEKVA